MFINLRPIVEQAVDHSMGQRTRHVMIDTSASCDGHFSLFASKES